MTRTQKRRKLGEGAEPGENFSYDGSPEHVVEPLLEGVALGYPGGAEEGRHRQGGGRGTHRAGKGLWYEGRQGGGQRRRRR